VERQDSREQGTPGSWTSPFDLFCTTLVLVLGLAIGWLDLHTTEVTVTILSLLGVGLLLGILQPVAPWRWAVLEVLGLPIMEGFAIVTGIPTAEPVQFDVRIVLVAFVFALLGSYAGAFLNRMLRRP
jgi:NO-binding membrane sensor protein with MHYT domain